MYKDPILKEMLKNEIIVMKELHNDHVVKILNVFTDVADEELFIILEFCERGDLR
jgi:serine/threonine protein kinase